MIHIEKGQPVANNTFLLVATTTGDYEDVALIECYDPATPERVAGAYQAQYVKYGDIVYRFSDPIELGKELLKLDPESSHTAATYVRISNELLAKMTAGTLEPETLDEVVAVEQQAIEERREEVESEEETEEEEEEVPKVEEVPPAPPAPETSTSTPETISQPELQVSTSTPPVIEVPEASTSTPAMPEVEPEATSTPAALRPTQRKIAKAGVRKKLRA